MHAFITSVNSDMSITILDTSSYIDTKCRSYCSNKIMSLTLSKADNSQQQLADASPTTESVSKRVNCNIPDSINAASDNE